MNRVLWLKVAAVLYVLFGLTACPHYPHGYNVVREHGVTGQPSQHP